jgi:formate hydrogenlyase transcriptional activator
MQVNKVMPNLTVETPNWLLQMENILEELNEGVVVVDSQLRVVFPTLCGSTNWEDLFCRLNIFPIALPALRDRKADIPEFVRYFVDQFATSIDKTIDTIPEETMRAIVRHPWPGNIRELQNYVARGVILSPDGIFEAPPPEKSEPAPLDVTNPTLEDKVRQEILSACQRANWKLGGPRGAAARLGLKRTTLFYKMKRLGIAQPVDHWAD